MTIRFSFILPKYYRYEMHYTCMLRVVRFVARFSFFHGVHRVKRKISSANVDFFKQRANAVQ